MKAALVQRLIRLLIVPVAAVLAVLTAGAPGAHAATDLSEVAAALRESPVYVDPAAADLLPESDAEALSDKIRDADKPVFVAVLPSGYPTEDLFRNLRTETGVTGVYGIRLGDAFDARADSRVLSRAAVSNLVASVQSAGDVKAQLNDFVDGALRNVGGVAPSSWSGDTGDGVSATGLITLGAVLAAGGAGAYALSRRNRHRHEEEQRAALEKLRVVVDEDITAFGEELDRLDFHPAEPGADDAMRADYAHALDAYETSKARMAAATKPEDVRAVTQSLEDGRFALAALAARRAGRPLPERRPPCFFDPRHGPSVADVTWTPAGGATREVPVCAADRTRLSDGRDPMIREVETVSGPRPYWDAGPAYGPWAGGYFGGGILPGLLIGTLLGSAMATPAYAADYGAGYGDFGEGGYQGGDVSGADFDTGDFGGGGLRRRRLRGWRGLRRRVLTRRARAGASARRRRCTRPGPARRGAGPGWFRAGRRVAAAEAIAAAKAETSVQTPGASARAQPMPRPVLPAWTRAPAASRRNRGPPESPWQVSTPPAGHPAQISSPWDQPVAGLAGKWGAEERGARKGGVVRVRAHAFLTAEMSKTSLILSEIRTPPVSSAAFQVRPHSERSSSALPSKPTRSLPKGSFAAPLNSRSMVIGLVTPRMDRSPVIR
ncbi:hypothetical protein GCM10020295_23670 [Streptomyces cinereospinus]